MLNFTCWTKNPMSFRDQKDEIDFTLWYLDVTLENFTQYNYIHRLPWYLSGKESTCNVGDTVSIPGSAKFPRKAMATHSSILAWEIPRAEKSGRLQSIESERVRHDLATEQQQQWHTHYFIKQISVQLLFFLIYWAVKVEFKVLPGSTRQTKSKRWYKCWASLLPETFITAQGVIIPTSHECWI